MTDLEQLQLPNSSIREFTPLQLLESELQHMLPRLTRAELEYITTLVSRERLRRSPLLKGQTKVA